MTNGSLMKVKVLEHSAILLTYIKRYLDQLSLHVQGMKTNFRSFLEWPFYTGFTVCAISDKKVLMNMYNMQGKLFTSIIPTRRSVKNLG